jgi:hypothetical protein
VGLFFTTDRLERWKSAATILSLLAVPVVLSVGGWAIQDRIAADSTQKEYVQIAIGILRDTPDGTTGSDADIREWAVSIVDAYAPVKLTAAAKEKLIQEQLGVGDLEWGLISTGSRCREYFILTGDNDGFEECTKRSYRRLEKRMEELREREQGEPNVAK